MPKTPSIPRRKIRADEPKPLYTLSERELSMLALAISTEVGRRMKVAVADAARIIHGLELQKRSVVIAATGKHSLLLFGPPGSGKTLLRAFAYDLGLTETYEAWPCPCGWLGDPRKACSCTTAEVKRHPRTWPMAEMVCEVVPASTVERSLKLPPWSKIDYYRDQVSRADTVDPSSRDSLAESLMKHAQQELGLTHAEVDTLWSIAETVARLENSTEVKTPHVAEACCYRRPR